MLRLHPAGAKLCRGCFLQASELTARGGWQPGGHIWMGDSGDKLLSPVPLPCGQSPSPHSCTFLSLLFLLLFFLFFVAAGQGQRTRLFCKEIPPEGFLRKVPDLLTQLPLLATELGSPAVAHKHAGIKTNDTCHWWVITGFLKPCLLLCRAE